MRWLERVERRCETELGEGFFAAIVDHLDTVRGFIQEERGIDEQQRVDDYLHDQIEAYLAQPKQWGADDTSTLAAEEDAFIAGFNAARGLAVIGMGNA